MRSKHPKDKMLEAYGAEAEEQDGVLDSDEPSDGGDSFAATERRIRQSFSDIDFSISPTEKFMYGYGTWVHIIVPFVMAAIVGLEMAYAVLSLGFSNTAEDIIGLLGAIAAVLAIEAYGLSATFQLVCGKRDLHQNTARGRMIQENWKGLKGVRITLTCVDALGQTVFLLLLFFSKGSGSWVYGFLILIRTVGLIISDIYPAFWHIDPPTDAQQVLAENKMQAEAITDAYKVTEEQTRIASRARKEAQEEYYRSQQMAQEAKFNARSRMREMERKERRELLQDQTEEEERRRIKDDREEERLMMREMKRQRLLGNERHDADDD